MAEPTSRPRFASPKDRDRVNEYLGPVLVGGQRSETPLQFTGSRPPIPLAGLTKANPLGTEGYEQLWLNHYELQLAGFRDLHYLQELAQIYVH